ncbi:hypothetical protein AKJ16_DCAP03629, partial [Drosera capensis]
IKFTRLRRTKCLNPILTQTQTCPSPLPLTFPALHSKPTTDNTRSPNPLSSHSIPHVTGSSGHPLAIHSPHPHPSPQFLITIHLAGFLSSAASPADANDRVVRYC